MKKLLWNLLLAALCGVFLYSGWMLHHIQGEYRTAAEAADFAAGYVTVRETQAASAPEEVSDDTLWPEVDFEGLQAVNPDVVGWICIEGTAVNYPIVQGEDNNYYLRRLMDGTRNGSGTIFLDCDCEGDFSGKNSVLYGHNMNNGTMFRPIMSYKKQSFYDEHPVALLMTPQGNYRIRFFSGYVADLDESAWDLFFTDEAYSQWLVEITGRSCFESTVTPEATDRIVTLSTCSYEFDNARFVLHGIVEDCG